MQTLENITNPQVILNNDQKQMVDNFVNLLTSVGENDMPIVNALIAGAKFSVNFQKESGQPTA